MIEITVPVQMTVSLTFRVDKETWQLMMPDEQKAAIADEIAIMQRTLDRNGGVQNAGAELYGVIEDFKADAISIYDPEREA